MSDILPISPTLPTTRENVLVSQTFNANLTEPGATLVSLQVNPVDVNDGIYVTGNQYSGQYIGVFILNGGLKYRLKTGELETADTWEELPDPETADLYSFLAPQVMEKTYSYNVTMIYDVIAPVVPGEPIVPPARYTVNKTYTQLVVGEWTVWANNLRDYVNRGI